MENIETIIEKLRTAQRNYYWPERHSLIFCSAAYGCLLVDIGGSEPGLSPVTNGRRLRDVALLPDIVESDLGPVLDVMPYGEDDFTAKVLGMIEMPRLQEIEDLAIRSIEASGQQEAEVPAAPEQEEAVVPAPTSKSGK